MVQNAKKRPGRPRAYDPDAALDAALEVFWRSGYASASLEDLTVATGMNKPSIYAAFGDKHALYLQAIDHYRAKMRLQIREAFAEKRPLRDTMMAIYNRALDFYFGNVKTPLGCFLLCAVMPDVVRDEEARGALADGLSQFDAAWRARIEEAQNEGEIGRSIDAESLAKIASGTLYYLSIRSRAGESRAALEKAAKATVDLICSV